MIFGGDALRWLTASLGIGDGQIGVERIGWASSSSVYLVRGDDTPAPRRFVLRVLDNLEWLTEEPDLAEHEAAALNEAQRAGIRAPRLVAYASEEVGFGAPVVLMSLVEGRIDLRPASFRVWLEALASELAAIHRHRVSSFPWHFRSWVKRDNLASPSWSTIPRVWEGAITYWHQSAPEFRPVFIHRDYHPLNVLWRGSAVSGVVDWINACQGPAGVDVAHCRSNLVQMYGVEAAEGFLDAYRAVAEDFAYDPFWDIDSLLNMCLPRPSYYSPWKAFGLGAIAPAESMRRVDAHMERVMMRV